VKNFRFPRVIKRKLFNIIFGGVGKRRLITDYYYDENKKQPKRTKMQKARRAHQGWRNKIFGTISARKVRKIYGIRKPVSYFRR
jgi:hypothetical protein